MRTPTFELHRSPAAFIAMSEVDISVSNHGGRQLDCVPSSLRALPEVVKAINRLCRRPQDRLRYERQNPFKCSVDSTTPLLPISGI
jgi:hypothetical protein